VAGRDSAGGAAAGERVGGGAITAARLSARGVTGCASAGTAAGRGGVADGGSGSRGAIGCSGFDDASALPEAAAALDGLAADEGVAGGVARATRVDRADAGVDGASMKMTSVSAAKPTATAARP
jgi:hypothetical protein